MKIPRLILIFALIAALVQAQTGTTGVTKAQLNAALALKADARAVAALGTNALALGSNRGIWPVKTVTWSADQTVTYTGGSSLAGAGQVIIANVTTAMNLSITPTSATLFRNGGGTGTTTGNTLVVAVPIGIHQFRFWTPNTGSTLYLDDTVFTEGDIPLNRQTFSNANATISAGATILEQTGTMLASRTVTLAAASSYRAGQRVFILDVSGTVTGTNTLVVARAGSDTINGASTSVTLTSANSVLILESDGTSKFTIVSAYPSSGGGAVSSVTAGQGFGTVSPTTGAVIINFPVFGEQIIRASVAPASGTTWSSIGGLAPSTYGGVAAFVAGSATVPNGISYTSGATAGNTTGMNTTTVHNRFGNHPVMVYRMALGTAYAAGNFRLWMGPTEGDPTSSDTPSGTSLGLFRYSPGAGGDTTWKCITNDASGAGTVTDSGITPDANLHVYKVWPVSGHVYFFIDNVLVADRTTDLPVAATSVANYCVITTTDAVAKVITLYNFAENTP